MTAELTITLRRPHPKQNEFIEHPARRKVLRAGRRAGKTSGVAILAVKRFLEGRRILYATPTQEQVTRFWFEVKRALQEPIDDGIYYKNETEHIIELPRTENRIRAKTAWNANTLRGDYADLLILDEYQLMSEDAWNLVGAPMLLDNDGDAVFIYTSVRGQHHSKQLYKRASVDKSGRWQAFHFSSHDNPYLSRDALDEISQDMTQLAYRMEILAEDIEDDPRALWRRQEMIEEHRVTGFPDLVRVVVGVDPPGTETGAECGIVIAGVGADQCAYMIGDHSLQGSPAKWGDAVVASYNLYGAGRIIAEVNNGGDMVEHTIRVAQGGQNVSIKQIRASRGKAVRAEPVAALYEKGRVHHVGEFGDLEDQMCTWVPGEGDSPDRVDALVWALTELMLGAQHSGFSDMQQAETEPSKWQL